MECFIKVRVLRWQDWSEFFDAECLPLLKDLGTVHDVVCYEDIEDPYGGAFKATKNIQSDFPKQVISTPISEAAIAGVTIGLALEGKASIAEIMFSDFTLLCMDGNK